MQIRLELDHRVLATEPIAGLAEIALRQGNVSQATHHVQEILSLLERHNNLDSTDDPIKVYAICWQVLRQTRDARAQQMLETAHALLQARAAQIPDETKRKEFLSSNRNRVILDAWNTTQH